jgi:predicted nucleic acid-binding protein
VILTDTSVWADHLRRADPVLGDLLERGRVLMHPFVLGEIALGHLRRRAAWMQELALLPTAQVADPEEVLGFIESRRLMASGVGYVDVHLLATAVVTADCTIWTRDKRFGEVARRLGVAADPAN